MSSGVRGDRRRARHKHTSIRCQLVCTPKKGQAKINGKCLIQGGANEVGIQLKCSLKTNAQNLDASWGQSWVIHNAIPTLNFMTIKCNIGNSNHNNIIALDVKVIFPAMRVKICKKKFTHLLLSRVVSSMALPRHQH